MIKLKASKPLEFKNEGLLYVLYLWHEEQLIIKIGVTSRKIEERVVEILTSYYHRYRVFPKLYPKRFRNTENVYGKEAMLHRYFAEKKHEFDKVFNGSTEFFIGIDEDELLRVYDDVMDGVDVNDSAYGSKEE